MALSGSIVQRERTFSMSASLADIESELNGRSLKCLGFQAPSNLKHKLAA